MLIETVLETHSWPQAIHVFFKEASNHKDIYMMKLLIDELRGIAGCIKTLEDCLDAELDLEWCD